MRDAQGRFVSRTADAPVIRRILREELLRLVSQAHTAVERDTTDWDRYKGVLPGPAGHFRWFVGRSDVPGWRAEVWVYPAEDTSSGSVTETQKVDG